MGKTSVVWRYMDLIGRDEVMCMLCKGTFKYHNSTSAMLRHIQAKHFNEDAPTNTKLTAATTAKSSNKTKTTSSSTPPTIPPLPARYKSKKRHSENADGKSSKSKISRFVDPVNSAKYRLDRLVLGMIVRDLHPLSTVEDDGFVELLNGFDHRYSVPSPKMLSEVLLPQVYEETKDIIYDDLQTVNSISISLEVWSNKKKGQYLSVTGHYVTQSWEPRMVHLETLKLCENYKSGLVASELYRVFKAWDITSKIFCVTTDSSEEMASAVAQLNINHHVCYAKALSMVVKDAFNNVQGFLFLKEKVTDVVNYFQSNPDANITLAAMQKTQRKMPLKLKQEVESRWNSIYNMFKRYIELHECVTQALQSQGRQDLTITDEDLHTMKECVSALEPFEMATKDLSSNSFMSLSKVIPITRTLNKFLSNSQLSGHLIEELKSQLNQQFFNQEANMFLAASTYLDPRFREMVFESPDTCTNVQEELKTMIDVEVVQPSEEAQDNVASKKPHTVSISLWSDFDQRVQEARASTTDIIKSSQSVPDIEFSRYDGENLILRMDNPLEWWENKENKYFPGLCKLSKQFFSVPATSVPPAMLFTKEGQKKSAKRFQIKDSLINHVLFLHQNTDVAQTIVEKAKRAESTELSFKVTAHDPNNSPLKWNWT